MCGIFGIKKFRTLDNCVSKMKIMDSKLYHRGPDGCGTYINDGNDVFLGHRRLSIIDLSNDAAQPLLYLNKRYVITFNGEIYNYIELKKELINKGYSFHSRSDTEIIPAAYDCWGESCVNRFNGMWSFCLWDNKYKSLFCSRDRFGIKPFYYILNEHYFAFASEIKALTAAFPGDIRRDDNMIAEYLQSRQFDHDENTFFQPIKQLKAGNNLIFSNGKKYQKEYYSIGINKSTNFRVNVSELREMLIDSIKLRFRSDVEVGSCLSGGIDSSSIVSISSRVLDKKINAISAIYNIRGYDEEKYVDEFEKDRNINISKIYPDSDNYFDNINKMVYAQDEPILAYGVYSQWFVMKKAKENGVKVLLDGQGADEIFSGYFSYFPYFISDVINNVQHYDADVLKEIGEIYRLTGRSQFKSYFRSAMYNSYVKAKNDARRRMNKPINNRNNYTLDSWMRKSLSFNGLPALLHYEDRNSMNFSVEARVPFLDHRVVEKALSIPFNQKIHHGHTKYILRESMKGILPDNIYTRKNKLGYATPFDYWTRKYYMDTYTDIVSNTQIKNLIGAKVLDDTINEFRKNGDYNIWQMWQFLVISLWYKINFFE